ncbi:hypothetical protein A1O1_08451 [Capronia coronata CBS 617.96]|uniref:3-phytase n=1 Tax=Capronia coronata CBS 617.96 TaxID=1182541 RepID=W9YDA3_9EURO|nr:uncharacterized protein A1O1_08451 [Capronia coronata CBS 617.96]EXJ80309.1 hypothetical protein A1O1_08451 [Capronia coronata CBS 617.96]
MFPSQQARPFLLPSTVPKPKSKAAHPGHVRRTLSWIIFLAVSAFLTVNLFGQIRGGVCRTSSLLPRLGGCPAILAAVWDLFYHLGGNGPWIPRKDGVPYSNASLPKQCSVDQVHMLSRHAERYPTRNAGARHLQLLHRLHSSEVTLTGSLSFLKRWTYFTDPYGPAFENLTATGPFAGTSQAFNTGKSLRLRYDHLVPKNRSTKFWSCSSARDILTAEYFADGFFGSDWSTNGSAELEVIPEDRDRGADTLTPGDTCHRYVEDGTYGHDYGYRKLEEWQTVFTEPIARRLAQHAQGLDLSHLDIYSMMEMCGFEVLARGSSSWCNVFTHEEWSHFAYARDLLHFYRAGPGNSYAGAMGWLWLDATQNLMSNESSKDVYFSFVHDGDIVPVMATLQILNEHRVIQELPTNQMKRDRRWKTSDIVPMGGRLIFERIACGEASLTSRQDYFVRLFINDGLTRFPGLPHVDKITHAVRLADFQRFIASRKDLFGDFRQVCNLSEDAPDKITFLHQ